MHREDSHLIQSWHLRSNFYYIVYDLKFGSPFKGLFFFGLREEDAKIKLFLKRANWSNFPPYPTWFHQLLRGGYISEKFRILLFLYSLIQYTCIFIVFLSSLVYFYRCFLFWCLGNRSNPSHSPKVFSTRKRIPEHWSLF